MALSKTAKASMVKEVKQTKSESPEEALRQLRLNLAAGLYVTPDRIRVLLDAYDQAKEQILLNSWAGVLEEGKSYRVSVIHDEVSVEELSPEDIFTAYQSSPAELLGPTDHVETIFSPAPTIRQIMEEEEQNAEPASH